MTGDRGSSSIPDDLVLVEPVHGAHVYDFNFLLPHAPWFWEAMAWHCDPGCCGLEAYEFSHRAVRWVVGDKVKLPGRRNAWRRKLDMPDRQADALQLASALREVAAELRTLDQPCVRSSKVFDIAATPTSYSEFFVRLAEWLESPLPVR